MLYKSLKTLIRKSWRNDWFWWQTLTQEGMEILNKQNGRHWKYYPETHATKGTKTDIFTFFFPFYLSNNWQFLWYCKTPEHGNSGYCFLFINSSIRLFHLSPYFLSFAVFLCHLILFYLQGVICCFIELMSSRKYL